MQSQLEYRIRMKKRTVTILWVIEYFFCCLVVIGSVDIEGRIVLAYQYSYGFVGWSYDPLPLYKLTGDSKDNAIQSRKGLMPPKCKSFFLGCFGLEFYIIDI
jgi:hypothetical protein